MQVTLVTSNTKLVATSYGPHPANVGPTFQCLPRPVTRELLYNRLLSLSLSLSIFLKSHQHTHTTALRWPWP